MFLKKIVIFPAVTLSAVIPLAFTFLKKSSTEILPFEKSSNKIHPTKKRFNWRENWLEGCRPFNDEENTIYVCPNYQQEFLSDPFYLFYYKFEYKNDEIDSPFSVFVEKVSSLYYDQNQDILVAKLYKGGNFVLKDFPKEFRKLKTKSYLIPNQDCIWESDKLKWPNSPLSCSFSKGGKYTTISLVK